MSVKLYQSHTYMHYSRPLDVGPAWRGDKIGCVHVDVETLEGDAAASFRMNPADAKLLADMILSALAESPWAEAADKEDRQ